MSMTEGQIHKKCTRCKKTLPVSEFYKQRQTGKGKTWIYYDSTCKVCRLAYTRERSLKFKAEAVEYKGGKCEDCGKEFHPNVFDFHHLEPNEKQFAISEKMKSVKMTDTIKEELDKCVLLCANCHRERHIILVL